ncbi:MAG: alpha/beta hydrolase [Bacteroidetes bacterium]|nr:MAG: alpha/beta hydrolase [Bacteroidota bacterium]
MPDSKTPISIDKKVEVLPHFQLETLPERPQPKPFALVLLRVFFRIAGWIVPGLAARLALSLFARPRVRARHKYSDEILESAKIFEILYGNLILKGYEWGEGKETVLLVHGWESRGTALRSFVPGLLKAGYRVVTFDGPAHGDSQGKRTDLVHFAGAVKAVINKVGGVRHIITHSFGGSTTVFALSYLAPEISIDKLVLIAVPASTRKVVSDYLKMIAMPHPGRVRFRDMLQNRYHHLSFNSVDVEHSLANANVNKVLVVHDRSDTAVPFESAERIFENHAHVSMLVTHGFGHYLLVKQKPVIERVTAFICDGQ